MRRPIRVSLFAFTAAVVLALSAPTCSVPHGFQVTVLSGREDMVTGGDALVRIDVPQNVPLHKVTVHLNETEVTSRFVIDHEARTMTGLVDGLALGPNALLVGSNGKGNGRPVALTTLFNYPIEGPVFAGAHTTPFYCETSAFTLPPPVGGKLPASTPPNCAIPTQANYFYRTAANVAKAWPAGATAYPADLGWITNSLGVQVPNIVRMETGTINRAIYQVTVLHDPLTEPAPSFTSPPVGWNRRLIFIVGVGCNNAGTGGWYRQGSQFAQAIVLDVLLNQGYALGWSSLTTPSNNCNDVIATESMMMVKERIIETLGPPKYTIGFGLSGGAIFQHLIADNYPGLLDGLVPGASYPEALFSTWNYRYDTYLMHNYFTNLAEEPWTESQKLAVTGVGQLVNAYNASNLADSKTIMPGENCPSQLPAADRYHPVTNPAGVRCDLWSTYKNVFGVNPATGLVRRPVDNVGVQYGLGALNAGQISIAQFLELNEQIGGFDADGNIVSARTQADITAVRTAYQTGRMLYGGNGLASTPIIDYRAYFDDVAAGDNHMRYYSFSLRERLIRANGHADNQVMLVEDARHGYYGPPRSALLRFAFNQMDAWLENVSNDTSNDPRIVKIVRGKPATLQEGCNTRAATPTFIAEKQEPNTSTTCGALYPVHSFPRQIAGESIRSDVIKCQLKPIAWADYAVTFSADEKARLQTIFPGGVCDYSKPGVEQQPPTGTWLRYGP